MGNCAYRDIACTASDEEDPSITYFYARPVFDWTCDRRILAPLCRWQSPRWTATGLCAVYVIFAEGEEYSKIGISDHPGMRVGELQTSHWRDLTLYSALWCYGGTAQKVEAACHFSARERGADVRREWVRLPPAQALDLVLEVAAVLDVEAVGHDGIMDAINDECRARTQVLRRMKVEAARERATRLGY